MWYGIWLLTTYPIQKVKHFNLFTCRYIVNSTNLHVLIEIFLFNKILKYVSAYLGIIYNIKSLLLIHLSNM